MSTLAEEVILNRRGTCITDASRAHKHAWHVADEDIMLRNAVASFSVHALEHIVRYKLFQAILILIHALASTRITLLVRTYRGIAI